MQLSYFLMIFLLWWAAAATAAPVDALDGFLSRVKTLTADFEQEVIDEHGNVSQRSEGRFYLARPGRFRWEYRKPYRQWVIADGSKVWFYDPDLEQVTVRPLDEALGSVPALLLSGQVRLQERFRVAGQGSEGGRAWMELRPRSENDVFRRLRVELQRGVLQSMELADNFGQLTRIRFHRLEINPRLDPELFRFSPPPGVDVFEGT